MSPAPASFHDSCVTYCKLTSDVEWPTDSASWRNWRVALFGQRIHTSASPSKYWKKSIRSAATQREAERSERERERERGREGERERCCKRDRMQRDGGYLDVKRECGWRPLYRQDRPFIRLTKKGIWKGWLACCHQSLRLYLIYYKSIPPLSFSFSSLFLLFFSILFLFYYWQSIAEFRWQLNQVIFVSLIS